MLIKLYELNERYHDTKEKMAWLATSLYAAFSLAILRIFFTEGVKAFIKDQPGLIVIILLIIFCCALRFINFQYKKKRISVGISKGFMEILPNQTLSDENKLEQMLECTKNANDKWREYKKKYKTNNKHKNKYISTEWPINILIVLFFILQILIILYLKGWFGVKSLKNPLLTIIILY